MILVVGATGMLGGMIARHLLEHGREVRVLVRSGSDYQPLVDAGAEAVIGDLKDRASLGPAVQGARTVITTANSAMRGGEDNIETVDTAGNRNLIDAARAVGVTHFIFTSALGASLDSPVPLFRAKAQTEEYLKASGIPFTILTPNVFMEVWIGMVVGAPLQTQQPITLVGEAKRKHSFVSVEDVAAFAIAAVDNLDAIGRQVFIGGPEALSWGEVVERAGRVVGKPLPVQRVSPGEPVPGMPEMVAQMMAGFETYDSPIEMDETARAFGVALTPVDAFMQRAFTS